MELILKSDHVEMVIIPDVEKFFFPGPSKDTVDLPATELILPAFEMISDITRQMQQMEDVWIPERRRLREREIAIRTRAGSSV